MIGDLITFGYTGMRGHDDLRARLGDDVGTVVDIRLNAWSGNRAFSMTTRDTVQKAGYAHLHLSDLGNADYKTGGMRIRNLDAVETVIDLLAAGQSVALMCACPYVADCHRRLVADEISRRVPQVRVYHRDLGEKVEAVRGVV